MGRIKTRYIKSNGDKIFAKAKDEFTQSFEENKEIAKKYADIPSKRMRNQVMGHIVRKAKERANSED
ncbi:MAG: 30S ribosomal protein S17e [Nanoarchaeales archaeon]|nr:30S ribosomal protein S17e [Nanoarchaeales archaeon]